MTSRALPAALSLALLSCAPADTDLRVSAIAVAGDWVPPASTLAISNPQYVPVVDPPRITGTCMSTCPANVWGPCVDVACTGLLPGTLEVQRYLMGRWSYIGAGGNYSCRRNSNPASCDYLSVHSVGRAIDLMIPMAGADADNTLGDAVANWLIEHAEYIGVQRVIWDGRYWNGSRIGNHLSDISDTLCGARYCTDHHTNHIHLELSVDGANRRTRFFTEGPPALTCPVVCYGTAAVNADCTFTDCAATGQICVPDPPHCSPAEAPAAVRNAGATPPTATTVSGLVRYQPVAPTRWFDTRPAGSSAGLLRADGTTSGPLGPGRSGTWAATTGLPADTAGVWLNVAAVPETTPGFVSVFPAGASTDSSTVNFTPPNARANATAVALGAGSGVTFQANTPVNVVADLSGAFAPTGLGLRMVTPNRVVDTRATSPIAAGGQLSVDVRAPADARAVVVSAAVIPRGTAGVVTAFACDAAPPATANIDHGPASVIANTVISPLAAGRLCFRSSSAVDLVVDVTGFLVATGELSLRLLTPLRVLDTRSAGSLYTGRAGAGQVLEIPIASIPGLPPDARAVIVNLTSVDAATNGFATAYPCGISTPNTSSMNFATGVVGGNALFSSLGAGSLCVFVSSRTHLVADLLGVWVPTPGSSPSDPQNPPDDPEDPEMTDSDGGTGGDAGADARGDAQGPGPIVGSCGCHAAGHAGRGGLALLAVACAGLARPRRRRPMR